jgi:hypothetical protein
MAKWMLLTASVRVATIHELFRAIQGLTMA